MSTDTDRIVNFCPSFHAFWSLPVQVRCLYIFFAKRDNHLLIECGVKQVGVTLYLLYAQVGLAFLAGLSFALLLIPINRWIAIKVGNY